MKAADALRRLPAIDRLLIHEDAQALVDAYGRDALRDALRLILAQERERLQAQPAAAPGIEALLARAGDLLAEQYAPSLRRVINATGIIIHTNLGRALLSSAAQQALLDVAGHYNTLEYDLATGKRGSRYVHAEALLCQVTGAEAALIVNNNAAVLVLVLAALARDREVVLSRGQSVEIGGGFRIPEIMVQGGARLVEVGTTNRTRIADYARAISEQTALILRVHSSNFKLVGFVEEAPLPDLAALAEQSGVLLVDDLGSGALLDTAAYGLAHEPTVSESLAAGAHLVCFSGDKLLGGPQAGILVGRRDLIERLKAHPLARALRADKLTYAVLHATLMHYQRNEAPEQIPVWRMIAMPLAAIEARAAAWAQRLGGQVIPGESAVGGGSLPGTTLPTVLLALDPPAPDAFLEALRAADPPVIARIAQDRVLFDPRTVLPEEDEALLAILEGLRA